ncbi:hypothetical protein DFR50_13336 [Roseiarcus fermentans]|uniref:Uncharacterized protein n=1 Tax=Roseiarcus fermentans TaxID=1473586 RepID=A0A366ETN9_9HYPH|nr:hypothetical protein DFR50_13336 [Roseiarcus fermentans]
MILAASPGVAIAALRRPPRRPPQARQPEKGEKRDGGAGGVRGWTRPHGTASLHVGNIPTAS